jgi:hypothetical protein
LRDSLSGYLQETFCNGTDLFSGAAKESFGAGLRRLTKKFDSALLNNAEPDSLIRKCVCEDSMSDQNDNDRSVDQSDNFFGEPALLKGEDKTNNLKLFTAVAEHIEPENVYDWMMVHDTANNFREEQRFKRISADLIEAEKPKALEILLRPFCVDPLDIYTRPDGIARDYFSGDSKAKKEAASTVAYHGITPGMIEAKAAHLVMGPLVAFDRMSGNREKSRRILRKEHELRRKQREQRLAVNDNAASRASHGPKEAEA